MEEFDKHAEQDDRQLYDAAKKVTVTPLHREDQIEVEQSATEIAAAHANGPAIGNISSDNEVTGDPTTATNPEQLAQTRAEQLLHAHKLANPAQTKKHPYVLVIALVAMIGLLLFALLYR